MDRRAFIAAMPLTLLAVSRAGAGVAKPYKLALLIAGFDSATRAYDGGLEVRLDHGWKTYWRMPGDAGIPPQFDWSGSSNVKRVEVLWPAPRRFADAGGETVGYKDRVVFPLRIYPEDPGKDVKLDLKLFFGVCQDICIPGNGSISAHSGRADPAAAALIASFAAAVPRPVEPTSPFKVVSAGLADADGPTLVLAMEGQVDHAGFDVFVEGADFAYFKMPRPASEPSKLIIPFTTQGDPGKLKGKRLKLTMVAPDLALEQEVTVE